VNITSQLTTALDYSTRAKFRHPKIERRRALNYFFRKRLALATARLGGGERVRFGIASRTVRISHYAAVCKIRRIWLASGLRQLVRSEAS
jgi:hypothetical protein